MNDADREHTAHTNPPGRPTFTPPPREVPRPQAEAKPAPQREDDHPADEPGYGHGV